MKVLVVLSVLSVLTTAVGRTLRGSDEIEERFLTNVVKEVYCKPLRPHQSCAGLETKPTCMPYRSFDYCPDDESFPILVQSRTQQYRTKPAETYDSGNWFFTLEDKVAGYVFSAFEGYRAPEMRLCSDDINALDSYVFMPGEGVVIKASRLHSNKGVFVFPEGFGANGMAADLVTNQMFSLADVKTVLSASNASTYVVEEYIAGKGLGRLPTEYKFHMIDGEVVSINVVYNRESEHCGCWAEVDLDWNRLDKYGCFKPSGTAQADGQCYAIDFAEGASDPYPMKGLNFCSDPVPRPLECQLQDMISVAKSVSLRVGAYMRVDMFISDTNEIVVQEYTTNHANGLRHCSAIKHPSGCIDSCFMGRAWKETGSPLYGGGSTFVSAGIDQWWKARSSVKDSCSVALSYKPKKWATTCPVPADLAPNCARITPENGGSANLTDVASVEFGASAFTETAIVCVNQTFSSELDAIFDSSTAGKNIQDKMKYHVQIESDKPPVPGTTSVVTVDVPDSIAETTDNGATVEVYVLVDDDDDPSTPPVYKAFVGTYVAPPGTTDPKIVVSLPSTAYLPSPDGKSFVATVTVAATSQINCGIVRPTGGEAMLEGVAKVEFGPAVFTDDSEVCVTKTNEDAIQAIFDSSTSQRNIQDVLDYEVNVISQLKPDVASKNVNITLTVPDKLAANVELGAAIVPFVLVDHDPDDPGLDFEQVAGTYDPATKTITFNLKTKSFLPNIGNNAPKFTSVVTLAAMSPPGCDIIRPDGGTADLVGVASVSFGPAAFSESSEVCIEKVEDQALIDKLKADTSDPDQNVQDTAPFAVNITSLIKPADSSSISVVVPENLVQLTMSGASISAFVLLGGDSPTFQDIPATFNPDTGRATFVIPSGAYLPNPDLAFEATVILAASSPPGCEVLGPQGGTASTPGVGSITFQAGALGGSSEVCVKKIPSELNQEFFNKTLMTSPLNVQGELPYDVQITSDLPPAEGTTNPVTLAVPPSLGDLTKNGAEIVAFVLVDDDSDPTTPPVFMTVGGVFDETKSEVTFNLPPGAFFPPTNPEDPYSAVLTVAAVVDPNCEIVDSSGGTASLEGVASASFDAGVFTQKTQVCITNGTDPYISAIFDSSTTALNLGGPLSDQINITAQFPPEPGTSATVTVDVPPEVAATVENGGVITGFVLIDGKFVPVQGVFNSTTGKFEFDIPAEAFVPDADGGFTATVVVGSVLDPGCKIIGPAGGTAELEDVASATFTEGAFAKDTGVCVELGGPPGKIFEDAITGLNVQDVLPQRVNITSENAPQPGTKATLKLDVSPEIATAASSGATIQAMVLVETGDPSNPLTYVVVDGTFDPTTGEFTFEVGNNAFLPNGEGGFTSTVTLITTAAAGCDLVGAPGGTVDLVDVASASYPAGAFTTLTQVCITKTNMPSIQEIFDASTTDFNIQTETPYEVNIEADNAPQPRSITTVTLAVPPEVADDTADGATLFAYVLTDVDSDPATPPVFIQVPGVFNATNMAFTFSLQSDKYLPTPGGKFKATVIVASSSPSGCEIIGTSGGSVSVPSVGSASIRPETFAEDTEVCLLNGTDPVIDVLQNNAKTEFSLEGLLPYHVNLTANSEPSSGSSVRFNITVPDDLASLGTSLGSSIEAFVLVDDDDDPSTPPKFEMVSGTYDPLTKSIVFEVPSGSFFPPSTSGGEWTAVVTLGAVPMPSSSPSVSLKPSVTGSVAPSLSHQPSASPMPSTTPSGSPSKSPAPSAAPSGAPSSSPAPSMKPSAIPSQSPAPSSVPSYSPSQVDSLPPSVSSYPSLSPTINGCGTVKASGGMVDYAGGNVTSFYGPGVYNADTDVCIEITQDPKLQKVYDESILLFRALARLPYEVRIGSETEPLKSHNVSVRVPPDFSALSNFNYSIELFVLVKTNRGLQLQNIPSHFKADTQTVDFRLPPNFYLPVPTPPGSPAGGLPFEAVFTLAIIPGAPPPCDDPPCQKPANGTCEAASLQCPVDDGIGGTACTDPIKLFDRKTHLGIEYETMNGDKILSAAKGTVEFIGSLEIANGKSVVLRHSENSATLYTGLLDVKVSVGQELEAQEKIGTSLGEGLYFEYVPNGEIYNTRSRVDPTPCIGAIAEGSILVGDNGNFADDSFEIFIDGVSVGKTPVGALGVNFGVSNLRPGRHDLKVHIRVAPDAFGTYYVRLNDGVYFVDENNFFLGFNVTKKVGPSNANEVPTCDPPEPGEFANINPFLVLGCEYPAQNYAIYVPKDEDEVMLTLAPTPSPGSRRLLEGEANLRGATEAEILQPRAVF